MGRPRYRPLAGLAVIVAMIAPAIPAGADELAPPQKLSPADAAAKLDHKIIDEVRDHAGIMPNLRHLSDVIGPRLTGSANLEQANRWAADRMREYGLENVRLEPWELPIGWTRGPATAKLVHPANGINLMIAAAGWTPGTDGPVTGPVVLLTAKTKDDLAKYKGKLRGAIVLMGEPKDVAPVTDLRYGPVTRKAGPAAAKDDPPKALPKPALTDLRAFRKELADFLQAEGAVAQFTDAGKPHGLLITTGSWRAGDRGTPQEPLPRLFVAHEYYALLHRLVKAAEEAKGDPPRVELNVESAFVPGPITVFNTVGEIRGTDRADEFVVLGAHLDSWDWPPGRTTTAPAVRSFWKSPAPWPRSPTRVPPATDDPLRAVQRRGTGAARVEGVRQTAQGRDAPDLSGDGPRHRHREGIRPRVAGPGGRPRGTRPGTRIAQTARRLEGARTVRFRRDRPPVVRGGRRARVRLSARHRRVPADPPHPERHLRQGQGAEPDSGGVAFSRSW